MWSDWQRESNDTDPYAGIHTHNAYKMNIYNMNGVKHHFSPVFGVEDTGVQLNEVADIHRL